MRKRPQFPSNLKFLDVCYCSSVDLTPEKKLVLSCTITHRFDNSLTVGKFAFIKRMYTVYINVTKCAQKKGSKF